MSRLFSLRLPILAVLLAGGASASFGQTPLTIDTLQLPGATLNVAYDQFLEASGGSGSYSWSATGLPQGIQLIAASGELTGTPTVLGAFNVVVTVTDTSVPPLKAQANLVFIVSRPT